MPKTDKNLRQKAGPRHARILQMLRVAPVPATPPLTENPVTLLTASAKTAPKNRHYSQATALSHQGNQVPGRLVTEPAWTSFYPDTTGVGTEG